MQNKSLNKRNIAICCILILILSLLSGCKSTKPSTTKNTTTSPQTTKTTTASETDNTTKSQKLKYEVKPETFSLTIKKGNQTIPISNPIKSRRTNKVEKTNQNTSWIYPDDNISVSIGQKRDYLHVTIKSMKKTDNSFQWPNISGETYYMPLGEGKRIPSKDKSWMDYLKNQKFTVIEQFSMPFWAAKYGDYAVLFIMENPYRNELYFQTDSSIQFTLNHQYPEIDSKKENSFRIYITENNPTKIAKIYRNYVKEQGKFVTLEEKAKKNPNIKKLYGAAHIYLWGENLIEPSNIKWQKFRKTASNNKIIEYLKQLADKTETGSEASLIFDEIVKQDYVSEYQKNIICRFLSEALKMEDLYNPAIFPKETNEIKNYKTKGIKKLNPSEIIQFNKHILSANLPNVFESPDKWMNHSTVDLIKDIKASGFENAWIGLNSWEQAYGKPELTDTAVKEGFLIGSYDSYHSIHEPGKEQWITAKFPKESYYENATITNKNGEKESGFQKVGRKLNPTLTLSLVKQRVNEVLSVNPSFNSWFIDCDATGEIFDDYTPSHQTTQQEDLDARLKRMAYIRDKHNMVIGSEGGNDFAASTIAFAHGIELKTFSWMDEDMKLNKESKYYIGKYYNPTGGVAEHFAKQIPIKKQYDTIFAAPEYDMPLFKLVYNDSVITSYHWDWSTFKIKDRVKDRMLREVLYNVPPLYHLDGEEWNKYKNDMVKHTKQWSQFSKQVIQEEMTEFQYLKEDGSIQMCKYGDKIKVVANFSDKSHVYHKQEIPEKSVLIDMNGTTTVYTPQAEND